MQDHGTTEYHRYAAVKGRGLTRQTLERYLPENYKIVEEPDPHWPGDDEWLIAGIDVAGWTLDGYVIPRLASGLYWARELYVWLEDDGDGESGPHLNRWLQDEPQTPEAMERRRREMAEQEWEEKQERLNR